MVWDNDTINLLLRPKYVISQIFNIATKDYSVPDNGAINLFSKLSTQPPKTIQSPAMAPKTCLTEGIKYVVCLDEKASFKNSFWSRSLKVHGSYN